MHIRTKLILGICAILALSSFALPQNETVVILYTSNINGVLRDCGCGEEKLGGMARLKSAVAKFRREYNSVYLIDTGDHLMSYRYPEKAAMVLSFMRELNYDFILKADHDHRAAVPVADDFYFQNADMFNYVMPAESFADLDIDEKEKKHITGSPFLVFHGDSAAFFNSNYASTDAKFIFLSHSQELQSFAKNGVHAFQAGVDTEYLGVLKLTKDGNSYNLIENIFFKLDSTIAEGNADKKRIDAFFANQEYASTEAHAEKKLYLGVENCAACHTDEAKVWEESNHAHAYQTLVNENRAFDKECLSCHTTGMGNGGFRSITETKQFINVQCESCHTDLPDEHFLAKNRLKRHPVGEANCLVCHTEKNSPNFNYKTYLEKITHWKTSP